MAGSGWRSGVCGRPAHRERFPAPGLQIPREEGRLGASGMGAGCKLPPYLQQGGCHAQPAAPLPLRGDRCGLRGRRRARLEKAQPRWEKPLGSFMVKPV